MNTFEYGSSCDDPGNREMFPRVSMQTSSLDESVLNYLQSLPLLSLNPKELKEETLFQRCVDHPAIPNHLYYEGYYHTKRDSLEHHRQTNDEAEEQDKFKHNQTKSPESYFSLHPRKGFNFYKPIAPIQLRAFIRSIRTLNKNLLDFIRDECINYCKNNHHNNEQEKEKKENKENEKIMFDCCGCSMLAGFIIKEKVFSDLSIQIHFGDEAGLDPKHLGWHKDSPNSLLHLGISIRGSRALHSKRWIPVNQTNAESIKDTSNQNNLNDSDDSKLSNNNHNPVNNEDNTSNINNNPEPNENNNNPRQLYKNSKKSNKVKVGTKDVDEIESFNFVEWQHQGDIYLSSPALFPHAVQYLECKNDDENVDKEKFNRIIAIQSRILLTRNELESFNRSLYLKPRDFLFIGKTIAEANQKFKLVMPDLNTILEHEKIENHIHQTCLRAEEQSKTSSKCIVQ